MTVALGEDGNPSLRCSGDTVIATYGNQSEAMTSNLTTHTTAEARVVTNDKCPDPFGCVRGGEASSRQYRVSSIQYRIALRCGVTSRAA
jgi:hypothetical protein